MNETDWPEYPTLYVSNDEREIADDEKIDSWSIQMLENLQGRADSLGWKYRIGATAWSRNEKFRFIYRAMVIWETDEGEYESVELLWQNNSGLSGSVHGPASELTRDTLAGRPFSMTGGTVVFSDTAHPDWMVAPSRHANDED